MIRFFRLFSLFCVLALVGCAPAAKQAQVAVATTLATTANAAGPVLTAAYQADGDRAIDAAPTKDDAVAALVTVRARWAPVWAAWATVREAHNAWATALESGASAEDIARTAAALGAAYCKLRGVVPAGVPLPEVPGLGCS